MAKENDKKEPVMDENLEGKDNERVLENDETQGNNSKNEVGGDNIKPKMEYEEGNEIYKKEEGDEEEEEDYEEYEEEEYEDEDYEDEGRGKAVIVIAIIVAAITAIAAVFVYKNLVSDSNNEAEKQQAETQLTGTIAETEQEEIASEEALSEGTSEAVITERQEETDYITPTSTPKPIPTATPTPTPAITEEVVNVSDYGNDSYVTVNSIETEPDDSLTTTVTEPVKTVMIGDVRFREMANVTTLESCGWVCSSQANYDWLINDAYSGAEAMIGDKTKVFISIGLNDINRYTEYASSINAKAVEWQQKGAEVYFVSVGPVASESGIANTDICIFNTYMYQNLNIPFIDAYNYLVNNGFESVNNQSTSYTEGTTVTLFNYINQFM